MNEQEALAVIDRFVPADGPALTPSRAVQKLLGLDVSTVGRMARRGQLPPPVRLAKNSVRYPTLQLRAALVLILTGRAAS